MVTLVPQVWGGPITIRTEAPLAVERLRNLWTQGRELLCTFRDFRSGYGVILVSTMSLWCKEVGGSIRNYLGEFYGARVIYGC